MRHFSKYLICSTERKSLGYRRFGMRWRWVNDDRISIFGWTRAIPLRRFIIIIFYAILMHQNIMRPNLWKLLHNKHYLLFLFSLISLLISFPSTIYSLTEVQIYIYTLPLILQQLTTTKLVHSLILIQNINILSVHCVLCNRLFPFSWFFHKPAEHPELSSCTSATHTITLKKLCSRRKCYHLPSSLLIFTLQHPVHSICLCFKHKLIK